MGYTELILIAIGLAMDAFAVAVCKGLNMTKLKWKNCFLIGLFFGGFQALMPVLGWLLGKQFESYISAFDHWIAFALLAFIGGKMIYESLKKDGKEDKNSDRLDIKELLLLSVATSIDALAVGITIALLPNGNIWVSAAVIGVITFGLSALGVVIGNKFGNKLQKKAELAGGIILVLIGVKILVEHLVGPLF